MSSDNLQHCPHESSLPRARHWQPQHHDDADKRPPRITTQYHRPQTTRFTARPIILDTQQQHDQNTIFSQPNWIENLRKSNTIKTSETALNPRIRSQHFPFHTKRNDRALLEKRQPARDEGAAGPRNLSNLPPPAPLRAPHFPPLPRYRSQRTLRPAQPGAREARRSARLAFRSALSFSLRGRFAE